jgi:hypothetical protein
MQKVFFSCIVVTGVIINASAPQLAEWRPAKKSLIVS